MAIKSKIKTTVKDYGYDRIIRELKILENKPYVKIGFPAESSKKDKKKQSRDGETIVESEFLTVLDVAIYSEFGTIRLPERSFIRKSFDENRSKYLKLNKELLKKIYSGTMTVSKALDVLGLTILNDIKKYMTDGKVKPDSLRVILQGGKTLVDTAQMMNSMTYKKVMNGRKIT